MSYGVHVNETYYLGPDLEHYRYYTFFSLYRGNQDLCYCLIFSTDAAAPTLLTTTKILVADNELVNALKQTFP